MWSGCHPCIYEVFECDGELPLVQFSLPIDDMFCTPVYLLLHCNGPLQVLASDATQQRKILLSIVKIVHVPPHFHSSANNPPSISTLSLAATAPQVGDVQSGHRPMTEIYLEPLNSAVLRLSKNKLEKLSPFENSRGQPIRLSCIDLSHVSQQCRLPRALASINDLHQSFAVRRSQHRGPKPAGIRMCQDY